MIEERTQVALRFMRDACQANLVTYGEREIESFAHFLARWPMGTYAEYRAMTPQARAL